MSGAPTAVSPVDLIFREVSVRGFWVKHWLEATAPSEIAETYGRLAALVADGTLRAPVAATYPLEQYREARAHAARAGRDGKILFASWARSARPRSTSGGPKSGPKFPVL